MKTFACFALVLCLFASEANAQVVTPRTCTHGSGANFQGGFRGNFGGFNQGFIGNSIGFNALGGSCGVQPNFAFNAIGGCQAQAAVQVIPLNGALLPQQGLYGNGLLGGFLGNALFGGFGNRFAGNQFGLRNRAFINNRFRGRLRR